MCEIYTAGIDYAIAKTYENMQADKHIFLTEQMGWLMVDQLLDARLAIMSLDERA